VKHVGITALRKRIKNKIMSKEKLPQVYEENKKVFNIPESFIADNPNNYVLGEKLRTMYNNRHNETSE
jgi:hypothetical protein